MPEIKPIIKKLLDLDFRLKPNLIEAILELAGEE
jgi:predicted nucleic acid-binding protein